MNRGRANIIQKKAENYKKNTKYHNNITWRLILDVIVDQFRESKQTKQ
jgi:hypothetical protein